MHKQMFKMNLLKLIFSVHSFVDQLPNEHLPERIN